MMKGGLLLLSEAWCRLLTATIAAGLVYTAQSWIPGKILRLERQIAKIKQDLAALPDLQPGSLSEQYNVCGRPNCRCKASPPQKHGPYYQLSFTRKGKSSSRFVKKKDVVAVRKQLRTYKRLRELVDRWIDLATELALLRIETDD